MNQPRKKVIRSGVNRACSKLKDPLFNFVNNKRVKWPVCYVPGLNLNKNPWVQQWDLENVMNLCQVFPYYCDMPKPLLPPGLLPRTVFHDGDPGVDMITTKKHMQYEAEKMSEHYVKEQKIPVIEESCDYLKHFEKKKNLEGMKLPKFLADMADLLEMDPDPLYDGHYNYYYTGGSMDNIYLNERNILIFPFADELIAAPLTKKDNSLWKVNLKKASKEKVNGKVYELRHRIDSSSCRIFTRLKHNAVIYTLTEKNEKLVLLSKGQTKSKLPLISGDLDPFDVTKACTLNMMGCLRIWDLMKGVSRTHSYYSTKKNSTLADTWRSIRYHDNPNLLTLTDRCCVSFIDLRKNIDEPVLTMCPGNYLEVCDDVISLEIPSQKEYRNYIGTYHKLFTLDSRSPGDPVQQTWTHQLESAPVVGNVMINNNEEEVITLSSQKTKDSVIILNTWQDYDQPHSFYPPYSPSHILDTLNEAHHLGKCLDPLLKRRLEMTTTGSQLIKDETGNLFHLLQNSVGDIFYQCISYPQKFEKDSLVNCHAYYALEMWEKQMLKQRQGLVPLVMSDQVNVEEAFNCFTRTDLKFEQPPIEETNKTPKWKQTVKKLMSYTDVLAPEILAAWEISETSENLPQAQPHQKVLNWLEMAPEEPGKQEVEESEIDDDFPMTQVNSQELISVSQQVRNPEIDDDYPLIIPDPIYDDSSSYFLPVKVRNNKKDAKKKLNHVAGF